MPGRSARRPRAKPTNAFVEIGDDDPRLKDRKLRPELAALAVYIPPAADAPRLRVAGHVPTSFSSPFKHYAILNRQQARRPDGSLRPLDGDLVDLFAWRLMVGGLEDDRQWSKEVVHAVGLVRKAMSRHQRLVNDRPDVKEQLAAASAVYLQRWRNRVRQQSREQAETYERETVQLAAAAMRAVADQQYGRAVAARDNERRGRGPQREPKRRCIADGWNWHSSGRPPKYDVPQLLLRVECGGSYTSRSGRTIKSCRGPRRSLK